METSANANQESTLGDSNPVICNLALLADCCVANQTVLEISKTSSHTEYASNLELPSSVALNRCSSPSPPLGKLRSLSSGSHYAGLLAVINPDTLYIADFLLNCILCIFGWLPGQLHAIYYICTHNVSPFVSFTMSHMPSALKLPESFDKALDCLAAFAIDQK